MDDLLMNVAGVLFGLFVLALGVFFTGMPGMRILKSYLMLRKLRKELEPVARSVGAKTSTLCDPDKGCYMYYFTFPEERWSFENRTTEAWITLSVFPDGMNVHVPSFSPPIEYSDDFKALVRAIDRLRATIEGKSS